MTAIREIYLRSEATAGRIKAAEDHTQLNKTLHCLIPLSPGVLLSVEGWDITQNRLLTYTDS